MPDIVIKVICRYRAELFFKISRKTKLSRLFSTFTERMEEPGKKVDGSSSVARVEATKEANSASKPNLQFIFTHNGRSLDDEQTPEDVNMEDKDEILAVELMDLTENAEDVEEWVREVKPSFHTPTKQNIESQSSLLIHRRSISNLNKSDSRRVGMRIHKSRPNNKPLFPWLTSIRAKKTLEDIFDGV